MVPVPTSGNKKVNLLQNKNLINIFVRETVQGKDATSFYENKSVKEVLTLHEVIPMLLQGKDDSAWYPPLWPLPDLENRPWAWRERSVVGREGLSVLRPCTFLSSDQCPWRHPCPAIPHQGREQVIYTPYGSVSSDIIWAPFCPPSKQHKGYVLCEFQASLLTP